MTEVSLQQWLGQFTGAQRQVSQQAQQQCGAFVASPRELAAAREEAATYRKVNLTLADQAGRLQDDNTALLAENARLRRALEDLERKLRGTK